MQWSSEHFSELPYFGAALPSIACHPGRFVPNPIIIEDIIIVIKNGFTCVYIFKSKVLFFFELKNLFVVFISTK